MFKGKLYKVLAMVVVLALVLTIPVGCSRPEAPEDEGDSGSTGDTGSGSGSGSGSDSGGSGSTGGSDADELALGADASAGDALGDWNAEWNTDFGPGQHYRYIIRTVGDETIEGYYDLTIEDAGGGNIKIIYDIDFGATYSGSFTTNAEEPDLSAGMDFAAWGLLLGLAVTPALMLGLSGMDGWEEASWTFGEGEDAISFETTGRRSYAGITGAVGRWESGDGSFGEWCINPNVPLALYCKIGDAASYMEYILVDIDGF